MDVFVCGSWKVVLQPLKAVSVLFCGDVRGLDGEIGSKAVRVGMVNSPTCAQA